MRPDLGSMQGYVDTRIGPHLVFLPYCWRSRPTKCRNDTSLAFVISPVMVSEGSETVWFERGSRVV